MAGVAEFAQAPDQALPRLSQVYADRVRPSFWKTDFPTDLFLCNHDLCRDALFDIYLGDFNRILERLFRPNKKYFAS
jgi:hypothetical protein